MGISEQDAIKELQTRDAVFVAYSQATKLPYVICDQESFNDQVWVFATEEEIKAFGKKKLEEKVLLMGMKYEKKDYPRFYGTLYAIGVNSVVWVDGENQIEVELTKIARQADFSQLEPKKQPLFNSTLLLSGIYFMQELRRPLKKEERTANMREMEEELGIHAREDQLQFIGTHRGQFEAEFHGKPFRDNERSTVYLYREPVDIKNLKLQESEVEEVIWMDFEECRKGIVDGTLPNCIYEGEFQMVGKALGIE